MSSTVNVFDLYDSFLLKPPNRINRHSGFYDFHQTLLYIRLKKKTNREYGFSIFSYYYTKNTFMNKKGKSRELAT